MAKGGCPTELELAAYQRGDLDGSARDRVKAHVVACEACAAKVMELSEFGALEPTREIGPVAASSLRTMQQTGVSPAGMPRQDSDEPATDRHLSAGRREGERNYQSSRDASFTEYPFLAEAKEPDELGRMANYRVLKLLGRGGMGLVFEAEDVDLRRRVALKVMHPNLEYDRDAAERFSREARVMASIKHPHLATIFQTGREGNFVFFAMELLHGQSLDEWQRNRQELDLNEALRIGREVAQGLAVLHSNGLMHRDIKPSNIWIESPGDAVKILDLGLTRGFEEEKNLTMSGMIIGTPGYMSPEQARGDPVDIRSDIFSLGCVLYGLAAGKQPFRGPSAMAILTALAVDTPQAVREVNPKAPVELSNLIARMLAKNPQKRPASAEQVLEELERIQEAMRSPPGPSQGIQTKVPAAKATMALAEDRATEPRRRDETRAPRGKKSRSRRRSGKKPSRLPLWIGLGLTAILLTVLGIVFWPDGDDAAPNVGEGDPVYLTDLRLIRQQNWPFALLEKGKKKKGPPAKEPPKEPPPIEVLGKLSPHGIFMHPPVPPWDGEPASLTYRLGKEYLLFKTQTALNDNSGGSESDVIFSIYGDERLLWQSRPQRRPGEPQEAEVSVKGVDSLRIEVRAGEDVRGAHAVWVEPALWK